MKESDKILVVDDVALMRDLLIKELNSLGFDNIQHASSGDDALNMIRQGGFSMVMLDINMPGISGLKTLQMIREFDSSIFTVIVSAHSSAENVKQAIVSGANGFIVKPYTMKKISDIVDKYRNMHCPA